MAQKWPKVVKNGTKRPKIALFWPKKQSALICEICASSVSAYFPPPCVHFFSKPTAITTILLLFIFKTLCSVLKEKKVRSYAPSTADAPPGRPSARAGPPAAGGRNPEAATDKL